MRGLTCLAPSSRHYWLLREEYLLARVAVAVEDAVRVRVRLPLAAGCEPRDKRLVPHLARQNYFQTDFIKMIFKMLLLKPLLVPHGCRAEKVQLKRL